MNEHRRIVFLGNHSEQELEKKKQWKQILKINEEKEKRRV
jgi:hypothetical protein